MIDLIDRQVAIEALETVKSCLVEEEHQFLDCLISDMKKLPSAEPERKKGKWIKADSQQYFRKHYPLFTCSACGYRKDSQKKWNYCPNCGARMDKE